MEMEMEMISWKFYIILDYQCMASIFFKIFLKIEFKYIHFDLTSIDCH